MAKSIEYGVRGKSEKNIKYGIQGNSKDSRKFGVYKPSSDFDRRSEIGHSPERNPEK